MRPVLAVFDFDGTLSRKDLFLPFVQKNWGTMHCLWKLFPLVPYMLGFVLKLVTRQAIKEKILTAFFGGRSAEELYQLGDAFARNDLSNYLKPDVLEKVHWHKSQGHTLIIVTANVGIYIEAWATKVGFSKVISSRLEIKNGICTGKLQGNNCWGPEKVIRLKSHLGPLDTYEIYAYGDSRGDDELLDAADHPHRLL